MEKFAGYGFNKSHAAAYALIAYQTAYFKAHHPAAFMAANLSLVMDDTDKVRELRDDAIAQGLDMLQPDVNASNYRFEPVDTRQIGMDWAASKARASSRSRRSSRRANPVVRSSTCSISAGASTSASSTGESSRRWFVPARSTPSIRGARRCSPPSASRSPMPSAPSPRPPRCRCLRKTRRRRRCRSS
jgi:hypothetical protein